MFYKTEIAYENWFNKYRYQNETEIGTWERVAKALASVEKDSEKWYKEFLSTLVKFEEDVPVGLKCTPGGRITSNIGTEFGGATLLNCFIAAPVTNAKIHYTRKNDDGSVSFPVDIKTPDSPDDLLNIFLTIMEQAKTLASEGGYGINIDWIRPRGSLIKGTGIRHPGVVSYLKVWDSVAECIVKGDNDGYMNRIKNYLKDETQVEKIKTVIKKMNRKGAMMVVMSTSHPDCEEFIRAKQTSGTLTKFNMSILMEDKFLKAVEKDEIYEQSFNGKVFKKIKAKDLYNLIMESTYNRGEPGVLFHGNMQKNNPLAYLGEVTAANPCGEVPGHPTLTTVCLLGSPNLTQYVELDKKGKPFFNWDFYGKDVCTFARMLDNVCDLSNAPLPSYNWAIKNLRQYGMGINGLGSTLMMLNIPYNSKEGVEFAKKIAKTKENLTWEVSALLAKEKGTFPAYDKAKFENTEYFKSNRITEKTKNLLRKYGARNGKTTTCPPAGTTAIICDNTSNGVEPVYLLEYERKTICGEWPEGLTTDNVKTALSHKKKKDYEYWEGTYNEKKYYYEPHNRGLCAVTIIRDYGYQWLIDNSLEKDHKKSLVTTNDLDIDDHLNIQEVVQYYNNQSVSKTTNVPNKYPFKSFKELYLKAWKRGLVGITTYRDGSMESVLSSIAEAEEKRTIIKKDLKLPDQFINGPTTIIKKEGMKFYIHFSFLPSDPKMRHPICMWIYTNSDEKGMSTVCNRASRELAKLALGCGIDNKLIISTTDKCKIDYPHNRLGRMVSFCMRHNIPKQDILGALHGIEGDNVSTLLAGVRKFIGQTIKDGTKIKGAVCGSCKGDEIVMEVGCYKCLDCGYAGCG